MVHVASYYACVCICVDFKRTPPLPPWLQCFLISCQDKERRKIHAYIDFVDKALDIMLWCRALSDDLHILLSLLDKGTGNKGTERIIHFLITHIFNIHTHIT